MNRCILRIFCAFSLLLAFGSVVPAQDAAPATKKGPSQAAVAAKQVTFGTLTADDPRVKAATKTDDLTTARSLLGKSGSFLGTVARVYAPSSNSVVLLDFAHAYRTSVTAVVRSADFARFPDLTSVKGKQILVIGRVSEFKGQPQVELIRPEDLKIIK
jgi:hypothetical protein